MNKKTTKDAAVLLMLVLCVLSSIATGHGGFITADTTSQITVLGCNATYLLTIENIGDETDTYNLSTINIDNASVVALNRPIITLDAGCSGTVTLNVADDDIIGPYCVVVNATSQTNAEVADGVEIMTAVVEE